LKLPDFLSNQLLFFVKKAETGVSTAISLPTGITGILVHDVIAKGIQQPGHQANKKLSYWILGNLFTSVDEKIINYGNEFLTILNENFKSVDPSIVDAMTTIAVNLSIQCHANVTSVFSIENFFIFSFRVGVSYK